MKFWAFRDGPKAEAAELWLEGEIVGSRDWWYEGETVIVPDEFRTQLDALKGKDITVWINSPGGDAFAGMCIYTLLKEHRGRKTCKIAGIAASAATIPPMACDEIMLSPASIMMIHEASTIAWGREEDLEKAQGALRAVNETMADVYAARCKRPRDEVLKLMHDETYMSPAKAIDLGFADGVMYEGEGGAGRPAALITLKDIKWPRSALDDHEAAERAKIAAQARSIREAANIVTVKL